MHDDPPPIRAWVVVSPENIILPQSAGRSEIEAEQWFGQYRTRQMMLDAGWRIVEVVLRADQAEVENDLDGFYPEDMSDPPSPPSAMPPHPARHPAGILWTDLLIRQKLAVREGADDRAASLETLIQLIKQEYPDAIETEKAILTRNVPLPVYVEEDLLKKNNNGG